MVESGPPILTMLLRLPLYTCLRPDNNAYGVICRYTDLQNFYVFLVSADGYYAIGKYDSQSAENPVFNRRSTEWISTFDLTAIRQG